MQKQAELIWTEKGKTYWDGTPNAKTLYSLYDDLVPDMGEADTVHGELVRAFSRLQYEYMNNGNCNARQTENIEDDCWDCMGSGEDMDGDECQNCCGAGVDYEAIEKSTIDEYYGDMLAFISANVPGIIGEVAAVKGVILDDEVSFHPDVAHKYTVLGDKILHHVLSTENKPKN